MRSIVITAGPTREPLDPVRFLSNYSSGKMGYALAQAALKTGAKVTLISGPTCLTPPVDATVINVITAQEMYQAVMDQIANCDIFIGAAAVADYRPEKIAAQKIKKNADEITIKLVRNPDILAAVAAMPNKPFVVGFAAETENVIENARQKLIQKNLDMIIANHVGATLAVARGFGNVARGFGSDENELTILTKDQEIKLARDKKTVLAERVLEFTQTCQAI